MTDSKVEVYQCTCCCGERMNYLPHESIANQILCQGCGCRKPRPKVGLMIRLYVMGEASLKALNHLQEVAQLLGASDDVVLVRENDQSHFVELPGEGITTRLEIAEITGTRQKKEKAKP
jgi:hypothetical protein